MTKSHITWDPQSLEILESLAGDLPPFMLHHRFNAIAATHGLPSRTPDAISRRLQRLRLSTVPFGTYISPGFIAKTLGIHHSTVTNWIKYGWIPARFVVSNRHSRFIHRDGFRYMANHRPSILRRFDRFQLISILDDPKIVDRVMAASSSRHVRRPIRCLTDGQRFRSCAQAGRQYRCDPDRVSRAARLSRPLRLAPGKTLLFQFV